MSKFTSALKERQPDPAGRRWLFVPYDQLSDQIGPLAQEPPEELGIVLVENPWKAARRPYHRQKLALVLANLRHFALEQAQRGVAVRHLVAQGPYRSVLKSAAEELGPLRVMQPAEWELRQDLKPLFEAGLLERIEHEGWLTSADDFNKSQKKRPWRMDAFYRYLRKKTGYLMDGKSPIGGKYSHDAANRLPWSGEPPAPAVPTFAVDDIKAEVGELIEQHFARHPGQLDLASLPATKADAEAQWKWAKEHCLHNFGPYEDALSRKSTTIFHSRVSPLVNIHRLTPRQLLDDILEMELPLHSQEGFLRQVLGWREFMYHVHFQTDGFRELAESAASPGDGGYATWSGQPWELDEGQPAEFDGGARPNFFDADLPLPPAYWGTKSGMDCLDIAVESVWDEAWSHHISRLMVLSNIATLLDIDPRELTDWFWVAYFDAYDWVVEPNVLGMGTFALGELFTTKPYVSGSNYINKMSDYCAGCAFDPKKNCPLARLYWAFLARHKEKLEDNNRLNLVLGTLRRRSQANKDKDARVFELTRQQLAAGELLSPELYRDL